jgi:AraC family transcriptional regulator
MTSATPAEANEVISSLIHGAVAAFDADRDASRRYLLRASAILRATQMARLEPAMTRNEICRGGLAAWQATRVGDYIEQHLADRFTGRDLANLVNISVGQLFRAFKTSFGVPPFRYIVTRRVEYACFLLQTTREPISQIAVAAGLCDQSHFCRLFRRVMGTTPAAWRRANAFDPSVGRAVASSRGPALILRRADMSA